jgi:hypothetical protein
MARNVVALYDDFQIANNVVRELTDAGFPRDNISIVANNSRGELGTTTTTGREAGNVADETGAGAGVGAGIGAAVGGVGGLLVGLGALTIPGIGPVIAAGPLAVALSTLTGAGVGAVAGGVTGGLLGALIGLGIPEEEAEFYAEGVRRGGVLVTVQADDHNTNQIIDILNRHDPIDIKERAAEWRDQGWTRFDPDEPSPFDQGLGGTVSSTGLGTGGMPTGMEPDLRTGDMPPGDYPGTFDMENTAYRNHYSTYLADSGFPYDYYVPAYRFGHDLYRDTRFHDHVWNDIEMDVRRDWEMEHPDTWDRFKMAIRHAWDEVTGQR